MKPQRHQLRLPAGEITWFSAGSGTPLVYLHPAGGVRWSPVLDGLAQSRKLHVPVTPGFDGTERLAGVDSMQALAKLTGQFIDEAIGQKVDVIGHSFGGWLACWLAVERPDLVDHLVLESPAGFRRSPGVRGGQAGVPALFHHPEKLTPSDKTPEIEEANRRVPLHYHGGRHPDEALMARVPEIGCMTLILQGTEDQIVPAESVQWLKSALPRSYLVYVWDAGHGMEVDQPARVLGVIEDFLEQSEAFVVNWGSLARDPG